MSFAFVIPRSEATVLTRPFASAQGTISYRSLFPEPQAKDLASWIAAAQGDSRD